MRYLWQHISSIISGYDGSLPLVHYLKHYYKRHPKLGSRDRRMLSTIVYSWYRCSKGLGDAGETPSEEAVRSCIAGCQADLAAYGRIFSEPRTDILAVNTDLLFSPDVPLSPGIERSEWLGSMLRQPELFIRIRKNKEQICHILESNNLPYMFISPTCMQLPNGAPVDKLLPADSYVVQDASSQETGDYLNPRAGEHWYDCCSGAGGKSLLLMDKGVKVDLTVSDKRASILHNLRERFALYGLRPPTSVVADASEEKLLANALGARKFDRIICDVPCTGSGTWARTPEQLYFFDLSSVERFSALQQTIAVNVAKFLKPGGSLIYITCSVFSQENEQVVESVAGSTGLEVREMKLINGIARRSDSMFAAVLQ